MRMEDTRSDAGWQGTQELLTGEVLTVDEVVARIDAVTLDQLLAVGRKLLRPEVATLAVVGPSPAAEFDGLI